ncbi:hypothetical protein Lgra_3382 [Legionella gratiana]|uniref:Uncharacterized protein n=1 Tax=Legionella gratiana TaxID=45066 RepID=A0A378JDG8_9GAMM|nr:hypothetical protein [Legionella gratiana]KTD05505.1 hypothetical protein Lgra_3382 [Legionella gratiana]STX45406.1 Uncharacterised protein [Legionella gratiana]
MPTQMEQIREILTKIAFIKKSLFYYQNIVSIQNTEKRFFFEFNKEKLTLSPLQRVSYILDKLGLILKMINSSQLENKDQTLNKIKKRIEIFLSNLEGKQFLKLSPFDNPGLEKNYINIHNLLLSFLTNMLVQLCTDIRVNPESFKDDTDKLLGNLTNQYLSLINAPNKQNISEMKEGIDYFHKRIRKKKLRMHEELANNLLVDYVQFYKTELDKFNIEISRFVYIFTHKIVPKITISNKEKTKRDAIINEHFLLLLEYSSNFLLGLKEFSNKNLLKIESEEFDQIRQYHKNNRELKIKECLDFFLLRYTMIKIKLNEFEEWKLSILYLLNSIRNLYPEENNRLDHFIEQLGFFISDFKKLIDNIFVDYLHIQDTVHKEKYAYLLIISKRLIEIQLQMQILIKLKSEIFYIVCSIENLFSDKNFHNEKTLDYFKKFHASTPVPI